MDKINDSNFYVGWGTLSLINANIAHVKGRGRLVWFVLSLFLGPIATLILVFKDPIRPPA